MSALQLSHLCHRYNGNIAVEDVTFSLAPGARLAIVGPSGCGKTTLMRLIAGFELPHTGTIVMDARTLVSASESVPAHLRNIGYLPQDGALFPHLSVAANIGFAMPGSTKSNRRHIEELAERVSLPPTMLARWPHELSGGQQQRVALARALAQKPALMLLDEPFSALDTGLRANMRNAVVEVLNDAGVTAILVTHDQQEALSFATVLAVMGNGRLRQMGAPMDLYLRPDDEQIATFLGEAIFLDAQAQEGYATCALGKIPLCTAAASGQVRIMLRPEQLRIDPIESSALGARAQVVRRIPCGSQCRITLALAPPSSGNQFSATCLDVLVPEALAPVTGSRVTVHVLGRAHGMGSPGKRSPSSP